MKPKMTLLIVDDEPLARRKIRSFGLDQCGYEIVAEAENGEDAWAALLREQPDIVVTDIGMPVMDGLALLKRIRESGRATKVLMLTCYEDFDKAKNALKLGASDYLTKLLLEEAEFIDSLNRIAQTIRHEEQAARAIWRQRLQEAAQRPGQALKAAYGNPCPQAFMLGGLRLTPELCDRLGYEQDRWTLADGRRVLFRLRPQSWAMLFCADRHYRHSAWLQNIRRQMREIAEHLTGEVHSQAQGHDQAVCLTMALTPPFYEWNKLPQAVGELNARLDAAFYMEQGEVPDERIVLASLRCTSLDATVFARLSQTIHQAGKERDVLLLRQQTEEWLRAVCLARPTPTQAQMMAETLIAMSYTPTAVNSQEHGAAQPFASLREREAVHISELRQRVDAWIRHVQQEWAQAPGSLRQEIRKALRFVQLHYAEELDLQRVARHVNLSATWFGTLFRNECGQSFHEYVTRFRLARARELLISTDLKVYEIAQQVGIPNARYFSRLFVENYAVRPLDCRKSAPDRTGQRA